MGSITNDNYKPPLDKTPRVPKSITKSRINNFMASESQFFDMGIQTAFWELRLSGEPHVTLFVYNVPDTERISFQDAVSRKFEKFNVQETEFAPIWSTHWFHVDVLIPDVMNNRKVVFQWDMDCEGMVWSTDGVPLQGLTGGTDQARHEYILSMNAKAGERYSFFIEAACNAMFGLSYGDSMVPDPTRTYKIKTADLVVPNEDIQALYHDLSIIQGIAYDTDDDSQRARRALWLVNEVIDRFHARSDESIKQCLALTREFLSMHNGGSQHKVTAIGHCHIDTAWLWPYDETKRKIARSWSSQIELMDRYPNFIFTASQTQQYEWLRELYPIVFEKIIEKEKAGQWEIIGGSWVEHDTNMPSGESLCRQMLLGQRFFEKYFGKRAKVFWLPDSFGYSGQLPQILKQSGCDYFFTQKLSWNNINKFPLTTFWWTGIDNTSILAHLTPAETYNAAVTPAELHKCVVNHHDIEYSNQSLLVFGNGDGGGGPAPEMLERLSRVRDVDGIPTCVPGTVHGFFEELVAKSDRLQSYKGELYLEFHRGTYTTQALVKYGNRKGEVLIRDVEFLATMAKIIGRDKYRYPRDEVDKFWKYICLNQFHDCLPGSAIGLAYKDVHKFHREVISQSLLLRHNAQSAIMAYHATAAPKATAENEGILVFNTLPWARTAVVTVPEAQTSWSNQQWEDGHELVVVQQVPGFGATGFMGTATYFPEIGAEKAAKAYRLESGLFVLENPLLQATFNKDGQLVQLIDKTSDRLPLIPQNSKGNMLQLYEDVPTNWDAWDVEIYHLQKYRSLEGNGTLKIVSSGPLKAELEFRQPISNASYIQQRISLTCIGKRIEFDNFVEWHEDRQFLKVEFTWDINSDHATYDIQYGVLRRPNIYNTTHDSARFEVCGHKFADLSEASYGVALLNDCKYGYATHGNVQRLSLLRSPKGPDDQADMGQHKFRYAIYPHSQYFAASDVMHEALDFNVPLSLRYAQGSESEINFTLGSMFVVTPSNRIIIDTVKLAEDDNDRGNIIILRLYEGYGGQASAKLQCSLNVSRMLVSNVLEDDTENVLVAQPDGYQLTFKAFQIMTLKVYLAV